MKRYFINTEDEQCYARSAKPKQFVYSKTFTLWIPSFAKNCSESSASHGLNDLTILEKL